MFDAVQRLKTIDRALEAARPNWSEIVAGLAQIREGFAIARERAEGDINAYGQLSQRTQQARERADQVGTLLRSEDKDRPDANQRYQRAVETLDRLVHQARSARGDWTRMLREAEGAIADLDRAELQAREDVQLANRAIAEIAEASRAIRQARAFSSMGVVADPGPAEVALRQAQVALQARNYEQAIERADAAEAEARHAHEDASAAARQRQHRMEDERRRRAAAESMRHRVGPSIGPGDLFGAAVLGKALSEASRSRPGASFHPSPSRQPSSPSSVTSWSGPSNPSSGSSQTNW